MTLAVTFVVGWCVCVWQIVWKLGWSPWYAIKVTSVRHATMAWALWRWRGEGW